MSKNTHNKRFEELKNIALRIGDCDNNKDAMRLLNGIRAGYNRSKEITQLKEQRIIVFSELIKLYK